MKRVCRRLGFGCGRTHAVGKGVERLAHLGAWGVAIGIAIARPGSWGLRQAVCVGLQ